MQKICRKKQKSDHYTNSFKTDGFRIRQNGPGTDFRIPESGLV
jgi:hypothetical protein